MRDSGVTSDSCQPYYGKDLTCSTKCGNGTVARRFKNKDAYYVTSSADSAATKVQKIKNEVFARGPVEVAFQGKSTCCAYVEVYCACVGGCPCLLGETFTDHVAYSVL